MLGIPAMVGCADLHHFAAYGFFQLMTPSELLALYPSKVACASAIGVSRRTIYHWLKAERIPPRELERIQARLKEASSATDHGNHPDKP